MGPLFDISDHEPGPGQESGPGSDFAHTEPPQPGGVVMMQFCVQLGPGPWV